jgi:hypothetical protein
LLVKEKIDGWQRHAGQANRVRFCWAIRFINWNKILPDNASQPAISTRRPVRS